MKNDNVRKGETVFSQMFFIGMAYLLSFIFVLVSVKDAG